MAIRLLLISLAAVALASCADRAATTDPQFDVERLNRDVGSIAERARPARLSVGIMDLANAEVWGLASSQPLPMQSVFKAPLGAAVLAEVDARRLSLDEVITIGAEDLSPQLSAISTAWPGVTTYTVRELLVRAVRDSDNTAADVLMKRIGGPGAVTAWLNARKVAGVRVDRYEREIQMEIAGLASFRPAWKDAAPITQVPVATRRAALASFMVDPRDTASADGMINFFSRLENGELLSPASRRLLLQILEESRTGPGRIRAGLPEGARLAHKTGTARPDLGLSPVVNDVGIVTLPDGRRFAIAVFLAGCEGELPRCEAIVADATRAMLKGVT